VKKRNIINKQIASIIVTISNAISELEKRGYGVRYWEREEQIAGTTMRRKGYVVWINDNRTVNFNELPILSNEELIELAESKLDEPIRENVLKCQPISPRHHLIAARGKDPDVRPEEQLALLLEAAKIQTDILIEVRDEMRRVVELSTMILSQLRGQKK